MDGISIVCAWVLMKKCKTCDYKKIFSKLKSEAIKHSILLKPQKVMTGMELGAMNAFKWHWPEIELKVCLFHLVTLFLRI